jgi:hypothetical protein
MLSFCLLNTAEFVHFRAKSVVDCFTFECLLLLLPMHKQSITSEMQSVYDAIAACDTSESAPVVLFVSKMVPVKRGDIVDANGTYVLAFEYTTCSCT